MGRPVLPSGRMTAEPEAQYPQSPAGKPLSARNCATFASRAGPKCHTVRRNEAHQVSRMPVRSERRQALFVAAATRVIVVARGRGILQRAATGLSTPRPRCRPKCSRSQESSRRHDSGIAGRSAPDLKNRPARSCRRRAPCGPRAAARRRSPAGIR